MIGIDSRQYRALVIVGLPAVVAAQSNPRVLHAVPLPSIGLPLPQIGLPLPSIGLPRAVETPPRANRDRPSHEAHDQRGPSGARRHVGSNRGVFYFFPTYGVSYYGRDYPFAAPGATATHLPDEYARHQEPRPLTGTLRLDVQPSRIVQLYVDGFFVGTSDDVNGELALEAGAHRIEMRATGYESLDVSVKIVAGRSLTYRGALTPTDAKTSPETTDRTTDVAPAGPKTVYFIPGCYLGNVPPKEAGQLRRWTWPCAAAVVAMPAPVRTRR